ncbi:MAG: type IV pilus assembly protein PilM [Candidatus Aegiribacteria sp.]|nr:type IV pilus assembly protein PilM [Candidatus Aegiribacteria sp.]
MFIFGRSGGGTVGLDIGSHSIKVVQLTGSSKSVTLSSYAIQELSPGTIVDGEVVNREHLIDTVHDVVRQAGIKTSSKNIHSAVSGRSVIVRRIPMEKMSEQEARQAIQWEAEQHIPFRIDEVSLDFKIINPEISPGQMEVLLVAAKKEVVDLHRGILQGAGLRPSTIELEQFSLQRVYQHAYRPTGDECVTILNIGAEVTNMVVVREGLPSFNRDLSIGGSRFVEALQRSLGLEYDVALGVLKGNVPDGVSSEEVHTAIGRVIEELSTSIRRSFITYQASGENTRIDKMYISGGCSLMPGLATILSEQHGLPVEHFQPFRNITVPETVISDDNLDSMGAVLAVCTGLALRGYETSMVDINILEQPEGKRKAAAGTPSAAEPSSILTILCIIPYLGLIAGGVIAYMDYQDLKTQETELNQEIVQVTEQISQLGLRLDQQIEADRLRSLVDRKHQQILDLSLNQKYTVYIVEYLCRAVYPEMVTPGAESEKGIYITSLIIDPREIGISGVAKTWGDIIEFQRNIVEIMPDGHTSLFSLEDYGQTYTLASEANRTGSRRYNFEMTIGVNPLALSSLVGEFAGTSRDLTSIFADVDDEEESEDHPGNTGEES